MFIIFLAKIQYITYISNSMYQSTIFPIFKKNNKISVFLLNEFRTLNSTSLEICCPWIYIQTGSSAWRIYLIQFPIHLSVCLVKSPMSAQTASTSSNTFAVPRIHSKKIKPAFNSSGAVLYIYSLQQGSYWTNIEDVTSDILNPGAWKTDQERLFADQWITVICRKRHNRTMLLEKRLLQEKENESMECFSDGL